MKIAHPLSERGHDLYETPAEATHALLKAEKLPQNLWEPACGPGAIVRVLRGAGHRVLATDLVDYGSPDQDHGGRDFLLERNLPKLANGDSVEAILTNPPFKLAGEFVEHALKLCPRVIMLLRLTFYESKRRNSILDSGQLARVHVFRNRLPMMHRANWDGPRVSNPTAFAWFVWHRDHGGPSTWDRVSWTPAPGASPERAAAQFEASLELPKQEICTEVALAARCQMTDASLLAGLRIRLERTRDVPCGVCGQTVVVIGKDAGPHGASLHCASCDRHRDGCRKRSPISCWGRSAGSVGHPKSSRFAIRNSRKRMRPRLWVHPWPHKSPRPETQMETRNVQ